MKVTARWDLTLVVNRELKRKKRKIDQALYLRMLRETREYTMLQRVASELYRAGISPQRFLRELHKDDWTLSMRVMEELERIDKGRNGYDPDKVPSLLPIYLVRPNAEAEVIYKGRPKRAVAARAAMNWAKQLIEQGWTEGDVRRAIDDVLDDEDDRSVIIIKADDELPPEKPARTQTKMKYYVHDGLDWQVFASPVKAKDALTVLKDKVMENIRRAEPMPDITARICAHCKTPLNGHVLTIRTEQKKVKKGQGSLSLEHLHMNCFWLHRIEPCRIPVGMEMLNPADGKPYVYAGPEKGGWKLKHEQPIVPQENPLVADRSPAGVPGPSDQNPPKAVPVAPAKGASVPQVRQAV